MTIYIEFRWNHVQEELIQYLIKKNITVLHNHRPVNPESLETGLRDGMALKHESGVIMRVVAIQKLHEDQSNRYVLAARNGEPSQWKLFSQHV